MKHEITIGQTDYTVLIFIPDSASTDGSGKTGLVAADLTAGYTRVETDNDVVHTDGTGSLNDLAALTTAHTDWGLKEVSNTLAPGLYRLDLPDGAFASGAWSVVVYVMVTTSAAAASPMEFVLNTVASDVAAIKAVTDAAPTEDELADALLKRDWTSVTGEASRSVLNALRFLRNKWSLSGGTLTVTEEDDSTTAWTATVDTDAAAEPIIGSDPS